MKYAKLNKEGKVVNILKISHKDFSKVENNIKLIDVNNIKVNIGDTWDKTQKTFIPRNIAESEEKTIYDEVKELKEKITKLEAANELSSDISLGPK